MGEKGLRTQILLATGRGDLKLDEMGAMLKVLDHGAPLLKPVSRGVNKTLGVEEIFCTLDREGNLLIAGENYMFQGEKVKVLREQFGAGNILNTYYRVYYLGSNLEEGVTVVEVNYPKGISSEGIYYSKFEPIKKETEEKKEG